MDFDLLMQQIIEEARAARIPVSDAIQPHVVVNTRAKTRYGSCRKVGAEYVIEISVRMQNAAEEDVRAVLAHEVLHTCRNCMNHGPLWRTYAARFSATCGYTIARTGNIPGADVRPEKEAIQRSGKEYAMHEINYVLMCESCGALFPRIQFSKVVQYPERYRCRCGGTLRRIK